MSEYSTRFRSMPVTTGQRMAGDCTMAEGASEETAANSHKSLPSPAVTSRIRVASPCDPHNRSVKDLSIKHRNN